MTDESNRQRQGLSAERRRLQERLADLEDQLGHIMSASEDANLDDEHDPEGATIAFERAAVLALCDATAARLEELAEAETRLDSASYGRCRECGEPIGAERLEALPGAVHCAACAAAASSRGAALRRRLSS